MPFALGPGKGLEHLLEAMAPICAERDDVVLVIAGRKLFSWETGSFAYVRRIDRQIAALGSRVIALGCSLRVGGVADIDESQRP